MSIVVIGMQTQTVIYCNHDHSNLVGMPLISTDVIYLFLSMLCAIVIFCDNVTMVTV